MEYQFIKHRFSKFQNSRGLQDLNYVEEEKSYNINSSSKHFRPNSIHNIVIAEIDISFINIVFQQLKSSIWWNSNGFYIIQNIREDDTCKYVHSVMQIIWKFNILSVVFMCHDSITGFNLYTFNPYNERAPDAWKKFSQFKDVNRLNNLTIFERHYDLSKYNLLHFSVLYSYAVLIDVTTLSFR